MFKTLDKLLASAVVLLGASQCLATFYFFRRAEEPAAWFFAGGMLLALVGALALLRLASGRGARGVRLVSLAASLSLALFYAALYWMLFDKFARRPSSFLGLFVVSASAAVSLLNESRARPR